MPADPGNPCLPMAYRLLTRGSCVACAWLVRYQHAACAYLRLPGAALGGCPCCMASDMPINTPLTIAA